MLCNDQSFVPVIGIDLNFLRILTLLGISELWHIDDFEIKIKHELQIKARKKRKTSMKFLDEDQELWIITELNKLTRNYRVHYKKTYNENMDPWNKAKQALIAKTGRDRGCPAHQGQSLSKQL